MVFGRAWVSTIHLEKPQCTCQDSINPKRSKASSIAMFGHRFYELSSFSKAFYPAVNSHITMENDHVEWEKSLSMGINGPFSIAMLNYQRLHSTRNVFVWGHRLDTGPLMAIFRNNGSGGSAQLSQKRSPMKRARVQKERALEQSSWVDHGFQWDWNNIWRDLRW